MEYAVGEIKLNETWTMNFRLKLNQTGNIKLFGPEQMQSKITFKDSISNASQTAFIPEIQCNIIDKQAGNKGDANMTIDGLSDGLGVPFSTSWPIHWSTTYNGSVNSAWEEIKYQDVYKPGWKNVPGAYIVIAPNSFEQPDTFIIDTSDDAKFQPGDKFCVQVWGHSQDVDIEPFAEYCNFKASSGAGQYIKLE